MPRAHDHSNEGDECDVCMHCAVTPHALDLRRSRLRSTAMPDKQRAWPAPCTSMCLGRRAYLELAQGMLLSFLKCAMASGSEFSFFHAATCLKMCAST